MKRNPAGSSEEKNRYGRQIEEAFEAAAKLAGSNLAADRVLRTVPQPHAVGHRRAGRGRLAAHPAGVPSGRLPDQPRQDRPRRPSAAAGNATTKSCGRSSRRPRRGPSSWSRTAGSPPGGGEPGPVPPANLTDHFALFAPIVTTDKQAAGRPRSLPGPDPRPAALPAFLNYAFQMAGYASQYHQFITPGRHRVRADFTQIESFARLIHGTLNPTEVAYHVANEGRKLIECDRLCVGVRHARKRVTVEAVSGADVVEKASTHVRRLRRLMEAVVAVGRAAHLQGEQGRRAAARRSPTLSTTTSTKASRSFWSSSRSATSARRTPSNRPARSLVLESFNPPEQTDPMVQRLEVVGKHAAPALYNAAQMKRVPLKFLWWPMAKLQEGIGGKGRFYRHRRRDPAGDPVGCMIAGPVPAPDGGEGTSFCRSRSLRSSPRGRRPGSGRSSRKPGDKLDPNEAVVDLYQLRASEGLLASCAERVPARAGKR